MNKLIGIILCLLVMCLTINSGFAAVIGTASYGYVEKFTYGDPDSNTKITVITGVHPLEKEFGYDIANVIKNRSNSLDYRYTVYKIHVNKSATDYTQSRINGQSLAQKYVVPDVIRINPTFVFDIHENRFGLNDYRFPRFLFLIFKDAYTLGIARFITYRMTFLRIYTPPSTTSVKYVTQPIANEGVPTVIYETNTFDSPTKKLSNARLFVNVIDNILYCIKPFFYFFL